MAGVGLTVRIGGDVSGLKSALGEASSGINVFGKQVSGKALGGALALGGAVGIAASAIVDMTSAAAADRDEQAKLNAILQTATGSRQDYTAAVDAAIAAGQEMAFTDSETRAALAPLVTSTGDVALATEQLAIAQDLARFAGVDLATAAEAVAKANQGQDKALKTLVPGLELGATATETLANAQAIAAGQAATFAKSSEGAMAKTSDAFSEITEEIGSAFLPVLDAILPALLPLLKAFGELVRALLPILIPLVKALGKALEIVAGVLVAVVKGIVDFLRRIGDAIQALKEFLSKVPLIGDALGGGGSSRNVATWGSLSGSAAAGPGVSTFADETGGAGRVVGGIQINIQGDPLSIEREVVRALRTYGRRNGVVVVP